MAKILDHEALTFDDVHMVPQYYDVASRAREVDLSVRLKNTDIVLLAPFIASPMDTVSGPEMAVAIQREKGGIAVLHRYCSIDQQAGAVSTVVSAGCDVGAAVGVNGDYLERASAVVAAGAKVLCVDIAHGHHAMMRDALGKLRPLFSNIHIMAGNAATLAAFTDLNAWGADSIRIGIGSGSICETRVQTGHGYPMLQNILDVAGAASSQIISDGGIRGSGDIVKALGAGADLVMMGSMFAGTDEAPGELIASERGPVKVYRGMASKSAQVDWRGFHSSNEGVSTTVPYKGSLKMVLGDMINGVKSGLSYSGARNIVELQGKATFVKVSGAAAVEATPHILKR